MKPYYQDENITLYHGDCLEVMRDLPKKSIDLICTDPPYGLNYNDGNDLASLWEAAFGGDVSKSHPRPIVNDGEGEAMLLFQNMLKAAKPILKSGACCCCCCCGGGGPRPLFARWTLWMDEVIGFKQAVVWDKGGLGMGIHYRRNYEFVLIAQNGQPAHRWNGGNTTPNVWRIGKIIPSIEHHPTEKPVALMGKIITLHSNIGDLILEPFCGGGATLVAAKQLGRKAIGVEIEEKWCELTVKRLSQIEMNFEREEKQVVENVELFQ